MALEQTSARRASRDCGEGEEFRRSAPFLLGLWRQFSVDFAPRRIVDVQQDPELFAALESEIIPRLMITNRMPNAWQKRPAASQISLRTSFSTSEREAFVEMLLSEDAGLARAAIEGHIAKGTDVTELLTDLFAWSARELGRRWEEDEVSFVDVTIGLCRLHEGLHVATDRDGDPESEEQTGQPSILVASVPGEQHILGALIASEQFRGHGWRVACETSGQAQAILDLAENRHFDLIGLSASCDTPRNSLNILIKSLRKVSRNRRVKLIAGGPLFERSPDLAIEAGADGVVNPGADPLELARNLLAIT